MLGPWDWKPSSGRMLLQIAHGFAPLAPIGGGMLCDVRDVASGILAAREHGQCGRNYILGGHNMTYQDMWRLFAEVTGGKPPWFCAGPFMRFLGGWGGDTWGKLTGHEPDVNSASVAMSSQFHCYHSMRAHTELGYTLRPARETVEVAWQWFLEHGVRLTRTAPATQLM
jgi:dihydroflavonol-4-reductase